MGWLQKIWFFFWKQEHVQSVPQKIVLHFHDLEEWLDRQRQQVIVANKLDSDVIAYTNKLKAKRWELECKVDEWQNRIPLGKSDDLNHFFVQTRKLLDLIEFPEELTVEALMNLNKSVNPAVDSLMRTIEQSAFAMEFSFLLDPQTQTQQVQALEQQSQLQINPLFQELLELKEACDFFDQKMTRAGMKTVEHLYRNRGQLEESL